MMLVAKLELMQGQERRAALRLTIDAPTTLRGPDAAPIDVRIENFSRHGFRVVTDAALPVGLLVRVGLSGAGVREAAIVRRDADGYGCAFMEPLKQSDMDRAFRPPELVVTELPGIADRRAAEEAADRAAWERRSWFAWGAAGVAITALVLTWFAFLR
jgi:hypothetical protein